MKTYISVIMGAALLMMSGNVFATGGGVGPPDCVPPPFCGEGGSAGNSNNENTNTNTNQQQQGQQQGQWNYGENNNDNSNANVNANNNENNNSANANAEGGQGGRGGKGGTGVGIGVGVGQGGKGGSGVASSNSEGGSADSSSSSSSSSHSSANNRLSNVGNSSVNIEGDEAAAATARAPNITPTSPCTLALSAGGQGIKFGISFGKSIKDEECDKREAVRIGLESGHPEMANIALQVYKDLEAVKNAMGEDGVADSGGQDSSMVAEAQKETPLMPRHTR